MSVTVWLDRNQVEEKLEQLKENDNIFSIDVNINDIDHDDLENEDWYEDRFNDHLDQTDMDKAREEGYGDGYETAKEENTNETIDKILILRDMIVTGSSDKNIIEKLKEILRNEGVL